LRLYELNCPYFAAISKFIAYVALTLLIEGVCVVETCYCVSVWHMWWH